MFIVIVVLIFAALIYGFYLMQKRHLKFSTRVFTALFCADTFWWYLTGDLWNWLGSDHPITRVDHNGGERLCSTAANVDHAIGFCFDRRGIYQDERKRKNQKISFTVLATLLGTTAIAALIGIVMVMVVWFRRCEFY